MPCDDRGRVCFASKIFCAGKAGWFLGRRKGVRQILIFLFQNLKTILLQPAYRVPPPSQKLTAATYGLPEYPRYRDTMLPPAQHHSPTPHKVDCSHTWLARVPAIPRHDATTHPTSIPLSLPHEADCSHPWLARVPETSTHNVATHPTLTPPPPQG